MSSKEKLTCIDLFAGIGGFRLGFEKAGFKCVFSSEIDKSCQETYKNNFNETPFGDITEVSMKDIPRHDVLTAGFPCQAFSICGKRKGFEDTRGTLFFNICEIIKEKKPKVILLENVKYLIYHNDGITLAVILEALDSLGYHVEFKVLNALRFGVPQNRERIIIFATHNKPFNFSKLKLEFDKGLKILDFLDKKGNFEYLKLKDYTILDKENQKEDSGLIFKGYRNKGIWKKGIRPNTKHLSRVHRQPNRIYSALGTHPTIPSQEPSGRFFVYIPKENKVRKLTIRECYRIMGFPEDFIISSKKQSAYTQLGNSVCIPMVYELAKQIKSQGLLKNEKRKEPRRVVRRNIQYSLDI